MFPKLTAYETLIRLNYARELAPNLGIRNMARYLAIRGIPMHLALLALTRKG